MYKNNEILMKENILLGLPSCTQEVAIKKVGELLYKSGYVLEEYTDMMFEREKIVSTYIGNGVAIPHGVGKGRDYIRNSGLVVLQFPEGILYNGNTTYLVIGISGKDNEHIKILSNIAEQISDEEKAKKLWTTTDLEYVYNVFVNNQ